MPSALIVAESESETRGFLERHLADDGFDVLSVAAGCEALELAERGHPDLLLLGNPLADGTAVEVCRRLREGEPGRTWDRDVPVIVLDGGEADAVDRVRAFDRGADDYLARPFVYDELLGSISGPDRRAISSSQAVCSAQSLKSGCSSGTKSREIPSMRAGRHRRSPDIQTQVGAYAPGDSSARSAPL